MKDKLEECMASARQGQHKCKPSFAIFVVGDTHPNVRDHVGDAIGQNMSPSMLNRRANPPKDRNWLTPYKGAGKPCNGGSGTSCDEYPFNASMQGHPLGSVGPGSISLRSVPERENYASGGTLGAFYRFGCKIPPGGSYKVVAVKGVSSGYVCQ